MWMFCRSCRLQGPIDCVVTERREGVKICFLLLLYDHIVPEWCSLISPLLSPPPLFLCDTPLSSQPLLSWPHRANSRPTAFQSLTSKKEYFSASRLNYHGLHLFPLTYQIRSILWQFECLFSFCFIALWPYTMLSRKNGTPVLNEYQIISQIHFF